MTKTKDGYKDTMKNLCYANFLAKTHKNAPPESDALLQLIYLCE